MSSWPEKFLLGQVLAQPPSDFTPLSADLLAVNEFWLSPLLNS